MKKAIICFAIFILSTLCFAQNSTDNQWILGTWRGISYAGGGDRDAPEYQFTIIFNSNLTFKTIRVFSDGSKRKSTGSRTYTLYDGDGNYFIDGSKLILKNNDDYKPYITDFYLASNGKILVFNWYGITYWVEKLERQVGDR